MSRIYLLAIFVAVFSCNALAQTKQVAAENYMNDLDTIKNEIKEEIKAELKEQFMQDIKTELMAVLAKTSQNLGETNCTEVEQCVAANFTEITNRLAADEANILLNGEAITQIVTVDLPELHSEIDKAVADFIANDTQLQVNIDLEIDLRTQKDTELEAKINEEMNFRAEHDDLLQKSIDNEATERIKQDNALESKIDAETNERTQQTDRLGQKDVELQNQIEAINYTPRFSAKIASAAAFYIPKGYITNFIEFVDVGDDFDPSFGTFTASQAGTYVFHFSGLKFSGNVGAIYFAINNQIAQNTLESDTQAFPLNGLVTVYLNVGDVVALYNQYDVSIYVDAIDPFTFHGYLVA